MPRMQVYLPDDLFRQVKRHRLSPSELLQAAVRAEVERLRKLDELERYLDELSGEVGEASASDKAWASAIAGRVKKQLRRPGARRAG